MLSPRSHRDLDLERHARPDQPGDPSLEGHAWADEPIPSPASSKGEPHPCCLCWSTDKVSGRSRCCAKPTGASQPFPCSCLRVGERPRVCALGGQLGGIARGRLGCWGGSTAASPWGGLELRQLPPCPRWARWLFPLCWAQSPGVTAPVLGAPMFPLASPGGRHVPGWGNMLPARGQGLAWC